MVCITYFIAGIVIYIKCIKLIDPSLPSSKFSKALIGSKRQFLEINIDFKGKGNNAK